MTAWLGTQGEVVNHKRVRRLMRKLGIAALYPKPKLSLSGDTVRRYPYLLSGVQLTAPIKFGVLISPIFDCLKGSFTWWL